jgi:hypothetical protein
MLRSPPLLSGLSLIVLAGLAPNAAAQCPEEPPVQYWTGSPGAICPCFAAGEEVGTVFNNIPAGDYPIQVLRFGIGWNSVGCAIGFPAPDELHDAIVVYNADLSTLTGATPVATLSGPVLQDCGINEYDLETMVPSPIIINSGPVTITLRFLTAINDAAHAGTGPAPLYDSGCQASRNVVFAIPGGWSSSCALGVTGDWVTHLVYRSLNCNGQSYCYGTPADCPCGNGGAAPSGCHLAQGNGGVFFDISNVTPDGMGGGTGLLTGTNFPSMGQPGVIAIRNVSPQLLPPPFGDGILCVGAAGIVRFGAGTAVNGTYTKAFTHGSMAGAGTFYYQLWFRNTPISFCDPTAAFNLSNGWELTWP